MTRWIVLGSVIVLAGCVTPEEQAKQDHQYDYKQCQNYGFADGTDAFAGCMQKAAISRQSLQQRQAEQGQQQQQFEAAQKAQQDAQNQKADNIEKFDKDGNPNFDANGNYIGANGIGKLVDNPDKDNDND